MGRDAAVVLERGTGLEEDPKKAAAWTTWSGTLQESMATIIKRDEDIRMVLVRFEIAATEVVVVVVMVVCCGCRMIL